MKTVTVPTGRTASVAELARKVFAYQNNILLLLSAFLLGGSSIAGGFLPFGAVFYAASYKIAGINILTAVAVITGTIVNGSLEYLYINAVGMLLFSVLCITCKEANKKISVKPAIILFISILAPQLILAALQRFLLYDVLKTFLVSFISFVFFFVFRFSIPVMAGITRKVFSGGEETAGMAIAAAVALSGMGLMPIWGFSIRNILLVLLLLFFSHKCGTGAGAAAGAAIGLITGASFGFTASSSGTYALCGMLAGTLRKIGKMGTALGFVAGNIIIAVYFNGNSEAVLYVKETITAGLLFLAMPRKLESRLGGLFDESGQDREDQKGYLRRIREITSEKLRSFSSALLNLSKAFYCVSAAEAPAENQDINVLFDRTADRVCSNCSLCMHCWERNFYDTYRAMFEIVECLELKGHMEESDIPRYFLEKCPRVNEFLGTVNNMYELFREEVVWKSRINESRLAMGRQYVGMSRLIAGLAEAVNSEISFLDTVENAIEVTLRNKGIRVKQIIAYKNTNGKHEICCIVCRRACEGATDFTEAIEKAVSDAVGKRMERVDNGCGFNSDGDCRLKLVEAENLKITVGIARLPKCGNDISGDNYSFMNIGNGKYMLALSDGIGSGLSAAAQSKAVVDMLENLFESGIDKDMAVDMINSALAVKSGGDGACTMDISVIDLHSGEVEIVKIGAAPTYIKKEDKIDMIRSASLPAGLLPGIDAGLAGGKVKSGDMVIMVTDGIVDSLAGKERGDRVLMKIIRSLDSMNPQQVADAILNEANRSCGGKPVDDMTVLAAKVWGKLN
ncbi:MAG: stage II sporulation protein E [Acetivibrionales bacterium]|jgi:stage II sporulation protein E